MVLYVAHLRLPGGQTLTTYDVDEGERDRWVQRNVLALAVETEGQSAPELAGVTVVRFKLGASFQ